MPDNYVMPAPVRPARPVHFPYELLAEAARTSGTPAKDIHTVTRDPDGRLIVTRRDRRVYVVCTEALPDGRGQTGALFDRVRSAAPATKYDLESVYFDPADDWDSVWTAEDLDLEAWRLAEAPRMTAIPAGLNSKGQQMRTESAMPWVGYDPIKARAAWLAAAKRMRLSPAEAVPRMPDAAACRRVIQDSGWLADGEVGKLGADLTPPALAEKLTGAAA